MVKKRSNLDKKKNQPKSQKDIAREQRIDAQMKKRAARDLTVLEGKAAAGLAVFGAGSPQFQAQKAKDDKLDKTKQITDEEALPQLEQAQLQELPFDERGALQRTFAPTAAEGEARGQKILGTSDPRAAVGAGIGAGVLAAGAGAGLALGLVGKGAVASSTLGAAAKSRGLLTSVLGLGGIGFGLGKRRMGAVADANEVFTQSTSNIGNIITMAESGAYADNPTEAVRQFQQQLDNISQTEQSLKILNRKLFGIDLARAEDELVAVADYRKNGLEYDRFRLQQALLAYGQPLVPETTQENTTQPQPEQ